MAARPERRPIQSPLGSRRGEFFAVEGQSFTVAIRTHAATPFHNLFRNIILRYSLFAARGVLNCGLARGPVVAPVKPT
jgi:hypothetical protein